MKSSQGGILLIDKPKDLTSFDVVERVRGLFRIRKVGHTGTLDPFATGLLVLCLGNATRLAPYIMNWDKVYEGTIKLGEETDTDDPSGIVVFLGETAGISQEMLDKVIKRFEGDILQVPPRFSAKKRNGVPSYRRARHGEKVELTPVPVRIDRLEVLSLNLPWVRFRARCSKGTYMRSIARDLGRALGCGGHLAELSRIAVGHLRIEKAVSMEETQQLSYYERSQLLLTVERVLSPWKAVSLSEQGEQRVRYGQDLTGCDIVAKDTRSLHDGACVRLTDNGGRFLAIGRVVRRQTSLSIHPERVWVGSG